MPGLSYSVCTIASTRLRRPPDLGGVVTAISALHRLPRWRLQNTTLAEPLTARAIALRVCSVMTSAGTCRHARWAQGSLLLVQ